MWRIPGGVLVCALAAGACGSPTARPTKARPTKATSTKATSTTPEVQDAGVGVVGPVAALASLQRDDTEEVELLGGSPAPQGSLSKDEIQTEVRLNLKRIRYCYENAPSGQPEIEGRLEVSFTIGATGAVVDARAEGFADKSVERCVEHALRAMQFPKPRGGGLVVVSYPFVFQAKP